MAIPVWLLPSLGKAVGGAIGKVLGKAADWVPDKKEYLRNKISQTKRKLYELQSKPPSVGNSMSYESLSQQLRLLEEKARNI